MTLNMILKLFMIFLLNSFIFAEEVKVEVVNYASFYNEYNEDSENIRINAAEYVKIIKKVKEANLIIFPKYGLTSTEPLKPTHKNKLDDFAINLENLENACTLSLEGNEEVIKNLSCAAYENKKHLIVHLLENYKNNYNSTIIHIDDKGFLQKKDSRSLDFDTSLKWERNLIPTIQVKNTTFEVHMLLDLLFNTKPTGNPVIYFPPDKFYSSEFFYVGQIGTQNFYVVENMETNYNRIFGVEQSKLLVNYTYTELNNSTVGWNKIEKDGCKIDYIIDDTSNTIKELYKLATYIGPIIQEKTETYTICALIKTRKSSQFENPSIFNFINISTETDSTKKYFTGIQLDNSGYFKQIEIDSSETNNTFLKITAKDVTFLSFGFIYQGKTNKNKNINKTENIIEKDMKESSILPILLVIIIIILIFIIFGLLFKNKILTWINRDSRRVPTTNQWFGVPTEEVDQNGIPLTNLRPSQANRRGQISIL